MGACALSCALSCAVLQVISLNVSELGDLVAFNSAKEQSEVKIMHDPGLMTDSAGKVHTHTRTLHANCTAPCHCCMCVGVVLTLVLLLCVVLCRCARSLW